MNIERLTGMFLIGLVGLLVVSPVLSVDSQVESLRGLIGVQIVVSLETAQKNLGLTTSQIQTDVELRHRLGKIPVLTKDEWLEAPGSPYLNVMVSVLEDAGRLTYGIDFLLYQTVVLTRNEGAVVLAATWTGIPRVGYASDVLVIQQSIKDSADEFINDYLKVNPLK